MRYKLVKHFLITCLLFSSLFFLFQNSARSEEWSGPKTGPAAVRNKTVYYIAGDIQNGGISGVYRGLEEASTKLGWTVRMFNGGGEADKLRRGIKEAVEARADAIVLGAFPPTGNEDLVKAAKEAKIVLMGWHSAATPGPTPDLFVNVTTDPQDVAKTAADFAIKNAHGKKIGVILFNDNQFPIANAKTSRTKEIIESCKTCKVLAVENVMISTASKDVPEAVIKLNKKYGKEWTHTLAINDIYFDYMTMPITELNRKDMIEIAAGDGSSKAIRRISSGRSQQIASVAEPLNEQGWQVADELNRAFAGAPPSGYVTKPILITYQLLKQLGDNAAVDSNSDYKKAYTQIWNGAQK